MTFDIYVALHGHSKSVYTKMDHELHDFLLQVEDTIVGIQQAPNTSMDDVEGIAMQAELPLRDVVLVEGFYNHQKVR